MALGFFSSEDTLTPEAIDRRRKLAEMLMKQGMEDAPIQHWTQGAARMMKSASGAYMDNKLNDSDKANREYANKLIAGLLGGTAASGPAVLPSAMTPDPQGSNWTGAGTPAAAPVARETAPQVQQQPIMPNRPQMPPSVSGAPMPPQMAEDGTPMPPMRPASLGGQGAPSPFGSLQMPVNPMPTQQAGPVPLWTQPGMTKGLPQIGQQQLSPSMAYNEPGPAAPMGGAPMPQMAANGQPGAQPSEQELVARTIAAEAGGKSQQEANAIAAVILNRAKSRKLSPADVVLERNQFEPWNGGPGARNDPMAIDMNSPRGKQAMAALVAAQGGQDPTGGATHFVGTAAQAALGRPMPAWSNKGDMRQQIGATTFYAPEGRVQGGAPVQVAQGPGGQSDAGAPAPGSQEAQLNVPGVGPAAIPMPQPTGGVGAAMGGNQQARIAQFLMDPRVPASMKQGVMPILTSMMAPGQVISRPDGSAYMINPRTGQAQQVMGPTGEKPGEAQIRQLQIQKEEVALQEARRNLETPKDSFVIIGEDEFGNKRYGFVDPRTKSITPYNAPPGQLPPGAAPAQPGAAAPIPGQPATPGTIPPAPPGVNPKVWRDKQTEKLVSPDKLTEGQSKDVGFYTRGVAANEAFNKVESDFQSQAETRKYQVPLAGNYLASDSYQKANQAARDVLSVILRKDTGAAVTPQEFAEYGKIFIPQPGEPAGVVAQKRAARERALEGIRLGLGSVKEIVEFANPKRPGQASPAAPAQAPAAKPSPLLDEARAAIAAGAPPDKVRARLKERGIDPGAL